MYKVKNLILLLGFFGLLNTYAHGSNNSGQILYPLDLNDQTQIVEVKRGQHFIYKSFEFDFNSVNPITILFRDTNGKRLRIERAMPIDNDTLLVLMPFDIPDGPFDFEVYDHQNTEVTSIVVLGDLQSVDCADSDHSVQPSCLSIYDSTSGLVGDDISISELQTISSSISTSSFDFNSVKAYLSANLPISAQDILIFVSGIPISASSNSTDNEIVSTPFEVMSHPWFNKYIFPGGYNEILVLSAAGAFSTEIQVLDNVSSTFGTNQAFVDLTGLGVYIAEATPPISEIEVIVNDYLEDVGLRSVAVVSSINIGNTIGGENISSICAGSITTVEIANGEGTFPNIGQHLTEISERILREASNLNIRPENVIVDPRPGIVTCGTPNQDLITYSSNVPNAGFGTTSAVIDTGFSNYIDSNIVLNSSSISGQNFINGTTNVNDDYKDQGRNSGINGVNVGHGTGIAMLIGDQTYGVAPGTEVLSIKACNEKGYCYSDHVIQSMCYAYQNVPSSKDLLINLSLGGNTPMKALERLIQDGLKQGVAIFASAGNTGNPEDSEDIGWKNNFNTECANGKPCYSLGNGVGEAFVLDSQKHYPAAYSYSGVNLISVGAVEGLESLSLRPRTFSQRGSYVDIVAPDSFLLKETVFSDTFPLTQDVLNQSNRVQPVINNDYYKGTSFTTPLVTGTFAAMKSANPNAGNDAIISCLLSSASGSSRSLDAQEGFALGAGILDYSKAISCIQNSP